MIPMRMSFRFAFIRTLPPVSDSLFAHPPALPKRTRSCPEHCLVLDLDETLVHCSLEPLVDAQFVFQVVFQGVVYMVSRKILHENNLQNRLDIPCPSWGYYF